MNIAIIPARGGSKRIPYKNIKKFCGMPIISYSIKAALSCKMFDEVMVSTDDVQIAEIAKEYGATVPFMRSAKTSDDFATTADVIYEVLSNYKEQGSEFEYFCCIYPTAPFITSQKLCNAINILQESKSDALVPVVQFSYPPLRGLVIEDNCMNMKWPEYLDARSQDLQPMYQDSGQFYFVRTPAFFAEKTLFCRNTTPFILSELEVQDIDNETDWKLAELKYQMMCKSEGYP